MKYCNLKNLCIPALAMLLAVNVTSCGDDNKDEEKTEQGDQNKNDQGNNGGEGEKQDPTIVLSSEEQKEKLNSVGEKMLDKFDANNLKYYKELADYLNETDESPITKWFNEVIDGMLIKGDTTYESNDWGYYAYNYHYTNYTGIYYASKFCGHFTLKNGTWVREEAKDLQFNFKDQEGKDCNIALTISGEKKKVYIGDSEEWKDSYTREDYYDDYYSYTRDEYIDLKEEYLMIPEKVNVVFTQSGNHSASIEINSDLSGISSEKFDIEKDAFTSTCTTKLDEFVFDCSKIAYDSKSAASTSFAFYKGNQKLMSISADGKGNCENEELKDASVEIDIMGEIQIKGKLKDAKKFVDYLDEADNNDQNESKFKSYVTLANGLADLGVYYNGGSNKQATVKLEPFLEDNDYGYGIYHEKYWYCEPVIYFNDETSYSNAEVFFSNGFEKLGDKLEKLLNDLGFDVEIDY